MLENNETQSDLQVFGNFTLADMEQKELVYSASKKRRMVYLYQDDFCGYLVLHYVKTKKLYVFLIDKELIPLVQKYDWWWSEVYDAPCYSVQSEDNCHNNIPLARIVTGIQDDRNKTAIRVNEDKYDYRASSFTIINRSTMSGCCRETRNKWNYRGVWQQAGQFYARISINGVRENYGPYPTPEDAARKYNAMAIKYHGVAAYINHV
jgi:hypothetical protein